MFNIREIDDDESVKSEQLTIHLSTSLICSGRTSAKYDGDEGGKRAGEAGKALRAKLRIS